MNKFWTHRAPAIVWALTLFVFSSIPNLSSPIHFVSFGDKLEHFVAFGILGALVLRAVAMNRQLPNNRNITLTLALGIFYGATDEFHQYFVPGRFVEFNDFLADSVGILAGALLYLWLSNRWGLHKGLET